MVILITENDYKWKMITYGYYLFMNTYYYLILIITTYIRIRKKEYYLDFFPALPILRMPKNVPILRFNGFFIF